MRHVLLAIVGCLGLGVSPLAAQPVMPKPGPEQEQLKRFDGTWEATVAFAGGQSKGTSNSKVGYGGFWLIEDFQGEFGGMKFEGRGTTGYDPIKKKYVMTWIDSMSPSLTILEGNFAKDGKSFTALGEGPSMEGKLQKMKSVYEFKDKNNYVFTMYKLQDGKEQEEMKITYKRK